MIEPQKNKVEIPLDIIVGLAIIRTPILNMCEAAGGDGIIVRGFFILFFMVYIYFVSKSIMNAIRINININKLIYCYVIILMCLIWSMFIDVADYVVDSLLTFILFMLFPFVSIVLINDKRQLYNYLTKSILAAYIIGLITGFLFIMSGRYYGADAMMATYAVAVPTSFYCYMMFSSKKNRLLNSFFSFVGIVMMFFTGSRGGFIVVLIALTLGIMSIRKLSDLKVIYQLCVIGFIAALIFNKQVADLLEGTRIFDLLESGDISSSSGREWYYDRVKDAIAERPLLGWGLYGDRLCTNGVWAHNIFLEILCDFGIVVGSLFLLWISCQTIKFLFIKKNKIVTILFLIAIPQLLVSNSYLLSCNFWIYIGSLISLSQESILRIKRFDCQTPVIT